MMNFKNILMCLSFLSFISCTSVKSTSNSATRNNHQNHLNEKIEPNKKSYLALYNDKEVIHEPLNIINSIEEVNGTKFIEVYDPLEPLNRRVYYFNYYLDKYILMPAVDTYEYITPNLVQKSVSNFFSNLSEINTFLNSLLQFEGRKATITLARFGINSTFGILGMFDVATSLELPKNYEDFGLTLAKYGVGNGPYLVLPGFGPSNLRDTTGKAVGIIAVSEVNPYETPIGLDVTHPGITTLNAIDTRKNNKNFRYYGTGSPFEYEYVRYFYTKYRETLVEIK
ncbi:MAG: MlaA family lipoprotein [Cetobacterium sp.]